ncbi:TIGR02328 family protein [Facklamia sp. P12937]|uniref:TIGR02328 family protein n=1 Tax=Facklamia sp. P12937 TaxID=3421949 RepID=UPI003D1707A7
MRLWHEDLIPLLPRQQLLGQHRECCALRGKGWGKPHSTVNYIFNYHPYKLYQYHVLVMEEMIARGYQPDSLWLDPEYRGQSAPPYKDLEALSLDCPIYPEHDEVYLQACLMNLKDKGIAI